MSCIISKILPLLLLFHYFCYSIISCIITLLKSNHATFIPIISFIFQNYCIIVFHFEYYSIINITPVLHWLCHFNQIGKLQLLMIKPRWLSWKVYLKQYPTYSLWLKPLCYRRLFDCLISLFQLFWATNMNVGMWQLQVLEVATSPVISLKIILRCCKRFFGTVENAQISPHFRQFCAQRLGE